MSGFVGRFEHSLDDKGRLILPVRFRGEFQDDTNLAHHFEGCLALWSSSEFARQEREMQELSRAGNATSRNEARVRAQGVYKVDPDRQGRVVIPASARAYAALEGDVLVIGVLDHLEIWNPQRFEETIASASQFFTGSDLDK